MAGPVLLVHDNLVTIATVRRLMSREGLELILATTASDAVVSYGHFAPSLVLLASGVEEGHGAEVLEELRQLPEAEGMRLVILGEPLAGCDAPLVPLPLEGASFLRMVRSMLRGATPEELNADAPPLPEGNVEEITLSMENALFGVTPEFEESDWDRVTQIDDDDPNERVANEQRTDAVVAEALEQAHREIRGGGDRQPGVEPAPGVQRAAEPGAPGAAARRRNGGAHAPGEGRGLRGGLQPQRLR